MQSVATWKVDGRTRILGLPTTFLIQRDGHIYAKQMGAEDVETFEEAIKKLLGQTAPAGN